MVPTCASPCGISASVNPPDQPIAATPSILLTAECLKELNETVAGSYVEEAPRSLMNSNPDFFRQFTLVIATQASCCIALLVAAGWPPLFSS